MEYSNKNPVWSHAPVDSEAGSIQLYATGPHRYAVRQSAFLRSSLTAEQAAQHIGMLVMSSLAATGRIELRTNS